MCSEFALRLGKGVQCIKKDLNNGIFALYKPNGCLSHPNKLMNGRTDPETLKKSLFSDAAYCFETESYSSTTLDSDDKIWLLHRLDKETSGVIVVSNSELVSQEIKAAFSRREVKKTYKALAFGKLGQNFPAFPITWKDKLLVNKATSKVTTTQGVKRGVKDAVTMVTSVQQEEVGVRGYGDGYKLPALLFELAPQTGYTHQLRVQLSSRGFGVIGDKQYGDFRMTKLVKPRRMYLHAEKIEIPLPMSMGGTFTATCPVEVEGFPPATGDV